VLELVPIAITGVMLAAYAAGLVRLRGRGAAWPVSRSVAAAAGGACVAAAVLPPFGSHDETFWVHVAQHLLLAMAAPALLALSGPVTLALRSLPLNVRRVLLRVLHSWPVAVLTAPAVALTLNVGGVVLLYFTGLYRRTLNDEMLHALVHLHMFLAGCLLCWAIIGIDPMPRRPRFGQRLAVLVVAAAAHDTISKFLYARDLPTGAGAIVDRNIGAELMYYGGTVIDVALAVALMTQWYRATGRQYEHSQRRAMFQAPETPDKRSSSLPTRPSRPRRSDATNTVPGSPGPRRRPRSGDARRGWQIANGP
jgi:putative membrane protein